MADPAVGLALLREGLGSGEYKVDASADDLVLIVSLVAGTNLPVMDMTTSDPYCTLKIHGAGADPQEQRSTTRPATLSPHWSPPEVFRFDFDSLGALLGSRLVLEAWDEDRTSRDDIMGQGTVALNGELLQQLVTGSPGEDEVRLGQSVTLRDVETNHPIAGKDNNHKARITISLQLMTREEADASIELRVYEYERYFPIRGWGKKELPNDPGRYNFVDADNSPSDRWAPAKGRLVDCLPEAFLDGDRQFVAPPGWHVTQPWTQLSHPEDTAGWFYTSSTSGFFSERWHTESSATTFVRRRCWQCRLRQDFDAVPRVFLRARLNAALR